MSNVSVIGLGYVGLPLAIEFDANGHSVVGYDVDENKIRRLADASDPVGEVGDETLATSDVAFSNDPSRIEESEFVVVTVPTPLTEDDEPDLAILESAGSTIGRYISPETTVVLESTVYPGATREALVPALEETSKMVCGTDFSVGYSPERMVPGDNDHEFTEIAKLVGGWDEATTAAIAELYESILDGEVYRASSIEVAEAAKCLENTQRDVNIAFVNEFVMGCEGLDIDPHEVLEAAATKWNFHEYSPGLVGGHCLPVDPYYLVHAFDRTSYAPRLIREARRTNERVPRYVSRLLVECLSARVESAPNAGETVAAIGDSGPTDRYRDSVLILGTTYKENTPDVRNSGVRSIVENLRPMVEEVVTYDPHVAPERLEAAFETPAQETLDPSGFDGLLVTVPHDELLNLDLDAVEREMNENPVLVDVPGEYDDRNPSKSGFIYERL